MRPSLASPPTSAASRPAPPRAARREAILQAARVCFARDGFHGASMQQICAAAGMSPGGVYRYFDSKERIVSAIAEQERAEASALLDALEGGGDLVETLSRTLLGHVARLRAPGAAALHAEVLAECARGGAAAARFHEAEAAVRGQLLAVLAQEKAAGRLDDALDVEAATELVIVLAEGLARRCVAQCESASEAGLRSALRRVLKAALMTRESPSC